MKFVKVMFLHLSVSHSVHRGEYLGRYTPGQIHPQTGAPRPGTPPGPGMPPWQVHPWDQVLPYRYTPWEGTPPGQVLPSRYPPPGTRYIPPGPGTPPQDQVPPWTRYPLCAVQAGRYGQQVGSMHPTGMHSFLITCTFGGGSGGWSMV